MSRGPLTARERELKDQLDEAQETIRQMREVRVQEPLKIYRFVSFTPTEACVLGCLSGSTLVTVTQMRLRMDSVNDRMEGCALSSVYVAICRIRAKLKRAMVEHDLPAMSVETVYGHGFMMSARSIANLNALQIEDVV